MLLEDRKQIGRFVLLLLLLAGCNDAGKRAADKANRQGDPEKPNPAALPAQQPAPALAEQHQNYAVKELNGHTVKLRERLDLFFRSEKREWQWQGGSSNVQADEQRAMGEVIYRFLRVGRDKRWLQIHDCEVKARYVWSGKAWAFADATITHGDDPVLRKVLAEPLPDLPNPAPGSLAFDAAQLAKSQPAWPLQHPNGERSPDGKTYRTDGDRYWQSEEIPFTPVKNDPDKARPKKGNLKMVFAPEKTLGQGPDGKSAIVVRSNGSVELELLLVPSHRAAGDAGRFDDFQPTLVPWRAQALFELTETDGKRFIKIAKGPDNPALLLEYSINGAAMKIRGGVIDGWRGWKIDLTKEITFKP